MTTVISPSAAARSVRRLGRWASAGALAALLGGATLLSFAQASAAGTGGQYPWLAQQPLAFALGAVLLALVSFCDLCTLPALHQELHPLRPGVVLFATLTAAVGDLLGVGGRLVQAAEVGAAQSAPDSVAALAVLEQTLNTAGFALVSVSFAAFGLTMLRGFVRWLGWVGLVAGVTTAVGQLPGLDVVFLIANAAFIAWYVGLIVALREGRGGPDQSERPRRASKWLMSGSWPRKSR